MATKQTIINKLWHILNLGEDYITGGYKSNHPAPPQIKEKTISVTEQKEITFRLMDKAVRECNKCELHKKRSHAVPGGGVMNPKLLVVGGVPDGADDYSGKPFSGENGDYLDKWLHAINLKRDIHCYLTTLLKCRPFQGLMPEDGEIRNCFQYLEKQIQILAPEAILTLGTLPGRIITGEREAGISDLRSKEFNFCGIPVFCTYHPYDVLRMMKINDTVRLNELRRGVWDDLKLLKERLGT